MRGLFAAVVCLYVAVVIGGYVKKQGYGQGAVGQRYTNHGKAVFGTHAGKRVFGRYAGAASGYRADGARYADRSGQYAQRTHHHNNNANGAASHYAQKAARVGDHAHNAAAHNNFAGYHGKDRAAFNHKDNGAKSAASSKYNRQDYYKKGDVYGDNVHYGFDKKYNKHANDDGVYVINDHSDQHSLDDYRDHHDKANRLLGDHAHSNYKSNNAYANRNSKYGHGAANKHYNDAKYGADAAHHSKYDGAKAAHDSKYGRNAGSSKYYDQAHDSHANKYDDFAAHNAAFGRKSAAKSAAPNGVQYGHRQNGGFGQRQGYNGGVRNGVAGHGGAASRFDTAAKHANHRAGRYGHKQADHLRNKGAGAYNELRYHNDHGKRQHETGAGAAHNKGYHHAGAASAAARNGFNYKNAAARSHHGNTGANHNLYQDQHVANNLKRVYHDKASNHKLYKKFHHSSNTGGNNYERLLYNRNKYNDRFGGQAHGQNAAAKSAHRSFNHGSHAASAHQNDKVAQNHARNAYRHTNYRQAQAGKAGRNGYYHANHNSAARRFNHNNARDNHHASVHKHAASKHGLADLAQHHYSGRHNGYNNGIAGSQIHAHRVAHGGASRGVAPNGFASRGFAPSGFVSRGFAPNGFASRGIASRGVAPNVFASRGVAPSGFVSRGVAPNGFASRGIAHNGFASRGIASRGFAPNGFGPRGFASRVVGHGFNNRGGFQGNSGYRSGSY
ncbi:filaggrin-2-like [Gigantopelta aegis]|uniref:filaggrin-2-like n=1 Tax=Gigantopelta aegis TaxID=1735272 RepID=UPI001B88B9FC|nr:filaggrin-2-like [Gigantopelta aegis]